MINKQMQAMARKVTQALQAAYDAGYVDGVTKGVVTPTARRRNRDEQLIAIVDGFMVSIAREVSNEQG